MEIHEMYDEDVNENIFFKTLQVQHEQLFERSSTNRCIICVPRHGSLCKNTFDLNDFQTHILCEENPPEQLEVAYHTMNGKHLTISNNIIRTVDGFQEQRMVPILFEETFFNKNEESYQVLCIEQPLEGDTLFRNESFEKNRVMLHYLTDCEELLWRRRGDEKMGVSLSNLHQQFASSLKAMKHFTFERCLDLSRTYYQRGLALLMKDKNVNKLFQKDESFADSLKLALESYLFHKVYRQLFMNLSTSLAPKDARFNKLTRNLRDLQLKELDVRPEYCQNVPRARKEMSNMLRYTTPMGKLICLRRVFRVLLQAGGNKRACIPLTTDDLLPIIVFVVVKAEMPYWWATFRFMTNFRFSRSNNDDEFGFYLATVEAALEHVSSKQLRQDLNARKSIECKPSSSYVRPGSQWQTQDHNKSRSHIFFQCIRNNDVNGANHILNERLSPRASEVELCHPLCDCERCKQCVARQQKSKEDFVISLETLDDRGLSALHVAAICDHTNVIDWLLSEGLEVSVKDVQGQTPLHMASMKGKQSSTLLLLHYKARPNMQDNEGNTPLHLATLHGQEDCVKALIYYDQGATVLDLDVANDFGDRPLHLAAKWGYYSICKILLENGANREVHNRKNQTPKDVAHNLKISYILHNEEKQSTPNHRRYSTPAEMILSVSSEAVNDETDTGACAHATSFIPERVRTEKTAGRVDKLLNAVLDGDLPLVKYNLGWTSDSDSDSNTSTPDPTDLCHPLCQCPKCAPLQKLPSPKSPSGLHINSQNVEGLSVLHVAAQCGSTDLASLFLRRGALLNLTSKSGCTPLHLALKNQRTEMVEFLLNNRADIASVDSRGNTALHLAALHGNDRALTWLLDCEALVNAQNVRENTPLHEASRAGHVTCVRLLIAYGADVTMQNRNEKTAVDVTLREEIITMLKHALIQPATQSLEKTKPQITST